MSAPPPLPRPVDGDIDIGYKLEISTTVTFIVAAIVVGLRFVARIAYTQLGLGWDDHMMMFALIQALVATIIDYIATYWGLGRHAYFLTPKQQVQQQYYSYLAQVFCIHALTFAKISICLTYIRVVKGTHKRSTRWFRWLCYTIAISIFVVNSIVIITFYAQCLPAEKSWNRALPGTCWSSKTFIAFVLLQGSFSAATDIILCILPIFLFKDLQIGLKRKVTLICLMGLGLITGIFAIVRTVESSVGLRGPSRDISFISIMGLMWAGMERNIAIMIGSIPSCHPLAEQFVKLTSRSFSRSSTVKESTIHSHEMNLSKGSSLGVGFGGDGVETPKGSERGAGGKHGRGAVLVGGGFGEDRVMSKLVLRDYRETV